MKIEDKTETNYVKFEDLQIGDVFAAKRREDVYLGELYFRAELKENKHKDLSEGGWAISLETGQIMFMDKGYMLTPVEAKLVVERNLIVNTCVGCEYFKIQSFDRKPCIICKRQYKDLYEKKREEG